LTLAVFVILFIFFSIFAHNFFTIRSVLNLLVQTSTFVILAIGATLVLIVGGIDFALGAEIALAGSFVLTFARFGIPIWLSMILAICLSGLIGLVNGLLVARVRLPSFIATLGMAMFLSGAMSGIRVLIGMFASPGHTPYSPIKGLDALASTPVFAVISHDATGAPVEVFPGVSWIVIIMVFTAVFFHFVLAKTRIGRYFYLAGSNQAASRLSGIRVVRVRILAFVLCGMLAGLTGVLLASRLGGAPGGAAGYEITGMACAMIGGASLSGGSGSIGGTVIGAFLLSTIAMGLTMMNTNDTYVFMFFNGFVVLASVYLEQIRKR